MLPYDKRETLGETCKLSRSSNNIKKLYAMLIWNAECFPVSHPVVLDAILYHFDRKFCFMKTSLILYLILAHLR